MSKPGRKKVSPVDVRLVTRGIEQIKYHLDFLVLQDDNSYDWKQRVNESLDRLSDLLLIKGLIEKGVFTYHVTPAAEIAHQTVDKVRAKLGIDDSDAWMDNELNLED